MIKLFWLKNVEKRLKNDDAGFSLVELSIVLVILGLLTGGILTGQSLIRAAELRSVTTEFQSYRTAINAFKDKYFYMPGDLPNATDFWGSAGGATTSGQTCQNANKTASDITTCNGNGDGKMNSNLNATTFSNWNWRDLEFLLIWEHLGNAGLIPGSYSGAFHTSTRHIDTGVEVPASKLGSQAWSGCYTDTITGKFRHALTISRPSAGTTLHNSGLYSNLCFMRYDSGVSPDEAWNIDVKIDDGLGASGLVNAINAINASNTALPCLNPGTQPTDYPIASASTAVACQMFFNLD